MTIVVYEMNVVGGQSFIDLQHPSPSII